MEVKVGLLTLQDITFGPQNEIEARTSKGLHKGKVHILRITKM